MTEEHWKVGDLAVCIDDRWNCRCGQPNCIARTGAPTKEEVLRVHQLKIWKGHIFLCFAAKGEDSFWQASGFRKIRPDVSPANDDAWVEQLRHLRKREPA